MQKLKYKEAYILTNVYNYPGLQASSYKNQRRVLIAKRGVKEDSFFFFNFKLKPNYFNNNVCL